MSGEESLRKTVRKSVKGTTICGTGALLGGLVGGPIGIGVGSALGAAIGASLLDFNSVPNVMREDFTETERQSLMERGRRALEDSKELVVNIVLDIIKAIFKCRSKKEAMELLLPYIEKGIAFILKELLRYMSG